MGSRRWVGEVRGRKRGEMRWKISMIRRNMGQVFVAVKGFAVDTIPCGVNPA